MRWKLVIDEQLINVFSFLLFFSKNLYISRQYFDYVGRGSVRQTHTRYYSHNAHNCNTLVNICPGNELKSKTQFEHM